MSADETNPFYLGQPKRRSGAGALFVDDANRVLMVEPNYKHTWEIPGGIVEAGEDPRAACHRECLEELGLDLPTGRLLVMEHQIEPEPRGDSLMFVYNGGVLEDASHIRLQADELRSFRFVEADQLERITTDRLARRIRQALIARERGVFIEMVNGVAVDAE
jgi:ADP-ribose pyrophosphatase YjhB (NUDIX family)